MNWLFAVNLPICFRYSLGALVTLQCLLHPLPSLVLLPWGWGVLNLFTAYIAPLIYYEHCQLNQAWSSKYTCLLYNTHCMHILASCNNCDWRLWVVDAFSLYAGKLVLALNPSFPFRILGLAIGIFPKSGKIPMPNPPPFSNICPRYARWGIPLIGALCL